MSDLIVKWLRTEERHEAATEILRFRAENEKLRAELEAIKSPPDYGTQKIMNEQIHYAGLIAQKDREIARLRAENEKLRRRIHLFKNTRNEQVFGKLMKAYEEIEKLRQLNCNLIRKDECDELRAENEKLREALNWFLNGAVPLGGLTRYEYDFVVEARKRAAAAALKEDGNE